MQAGFPASGEPAVPTAKALAASPAGYSEDDGRANCGEGLSMTSMPICCSSAVIEAASLKQGQALPSAVRLPLAQPPQPSFPSRSHAPSSITITESGILRRRYSLAIASTSPELR